MARRWDGHKPPELGSSLFTLITNRWSSLPATARDGSCSKSQIWFICFACQSAYRKFEMVPLCHAFSVQNRVGITPLVLLCCVKAIGCGWIESIPGFWHGLQSMLVTHKRDVFPFGRVLKRVSSKSRFYRLKTFSAAVLFYRMSWKLGWYVAFWGIITDSLSSGYTLHARSPMLNTGSSSSHC